MNYSEYSDRIDAAARGTIREYQEAVVAALEELGDIPGSVPASDYAWAAIVLEERCRADRLALLNFGRELRLVGQQAAWEQSIRGLFRQALGYLLAQHAEGDA